MKQLESYTLEDIKMLRGKKEFNLYNKELSSLETNRISKRIVEKMYGSSISDIMSKIEEEEFRHRSFDFFPGDLVIIYLGLNERRSKQLFTCDFSQIIIRPNDLYINYRPLVENITTGNVYILKRTIKIEPGYISYLPDDIHGLEALQADIRIGKSDNIVDYSHLNREIGGELVLQKLKRR